MNEKTRTSATGLPPGWIREEVVRQNGLSRGKSDIYYIGPKGKRCRSKPELIRHLGNSLDLTYFDYRTGKIMGEKARMARKRSLQESRSGHLDAATIVPNRLASSKVNQSVTKKTNHTHNQPANKSKVETNKKGGKPPSQLFKEKRLSNVKAVDVAGKIIESIELPSIIQAVGPNTTETEVLQQISNKLHTGSGPITGQPSVVNKDPCVWLNSQQPICKSFSVSEDDIRKQENRVVAARQRLMQAMKKNHDLQIKELVLLA